MDASARAPERIRTNGGACIQANTCTGLGVCARARAHVHAYVCTRIGLCAHTQSTRAPIGAPHSPARPPVHKRGRTIHAHTQPHKRTTTPRPTIGGTLTTPRERLKNPIPPTIPTHHPRGETPLERLKIASRICVTHTPIYVHARAGLSAPDPLAHLDALCPRATVVFRFGPKKNPAQWRGFVYALCGLSRAQTPVSA